MRHIFLRYLNTPGFILLILLGVAVQTSLFSYYPFIYLQPDVVLLGIIWLALKRGFVEGGVLTLICSQISEIHSSAPSGYFLVTYMCIYLLMRVYYRYFLLSNYPSLIALTLLTFVFWKLLGLGFLHLMGLSANQWQFTFSLLLPGAVMEGAIAIWLYKGFEYFDWKTFKDPRAQRSEYDDYQLNLEEM